MLSGRLKSIKILPPGGWHIAPGRVQNGLLEPSGGLLGAKWAPFDRQGRSGTEFGRLLGALGALLAALGPLWGSWGAPGASWGPFWPPGARFLEPFGPLFGEPLRKCENLEIRRQYGTFEVFLGPEGSKIVRKSTPGASWAALELKWRYMGSKLG